jgi:hypothetical protein
LEQLHAKPSVVVMLTACLLLIVREGTDDPMGELGDLWIYYTLGGLKILREYLASQGPQGPEADIIINDIESVFIQLEFVM